MSAEKIFEAITNIDEIYITEAAEEKFSRKKKISGWAKAIVGTAAAICVFAGIVVAILPFIGAGAGIGSGEEPNGGEGDNAGTNGISYMSYAGPAFPLASFENLSTDIIFERETNFDFSPYYPYEESYEDGKGEIHFYTTHNNDAVITDTYTVTNNGTDDVTFTAVYPTAGSISTPIERLPQVTVDGKSVETEYQAGPYSGGFVPVYGAGVMEGSANLHSIESWEGYKLLLESGEYLKTAFDKKPSLDISVKVYTFTIEYLDDIAVIDEMDNPCFAISFNYNNETTEMMYMGFNGGRFSHESGTAEVNTHIPKSFNPDYGKKVAHIIAMGGDVSNLEISCYNYVDGKKKAETKAYKINTQVRDMTLEEILVEQMGRERKEGNWWFNGEEKTLWNTMTDEEYISYVAEFMYAHSFLSDDPKERYAFNMLDDIIGETGRVGRVIYATFEVTVPAGETVTIETKTLRESSYDFEGGKSGENLEGFDLVTKLGTNLSFAKQTASVSNTDYIEIVYNNFGFDLPNGVTEVTIGDEEHYYMEIKRKE